MAKNLIPERGVYAIRCTDGRCYIGGSARVEMRWRQHRNALRRGDHKNEPLQSAWREMGETAFSFVLLESVSETESLDAREQFWIDRMTPHGVFNRAPRAGTNRGVVHTSATKAKLAAGQARRFRDPAEREKLSSARNRFFSDPAARKRFSELMTGVHRGDKNPSARLSEQDVMAIRTRVASGETQTAVAKEFAVTTANVNRIVMRHTWKHI